jgi:hypothetical protein
MTPVLRHHDVRMKRSGSASSPWACYKDSSYRMVMRNRCEYLTPRLPLTMQ